LSNPIEKVKKALLLTLPLIIFLTQTVAIVTEATEIHTPDFPNYLDMLYDYKPGTQLNYTEYLQLLKEFFNSINEGRDLEDVMSDPNLSKLQSLMREGGDLDNARKLDALMNYSTLSSDELIQGIRDDELRSLIQEAALTGNVSNSLLNLIYEMYSSGKISFDDYVRALYALRNISSDAESRKQIDSLLLRVLGNSLINSSLNVLGGSESLTQLTDQELVKDAVNSMLQFLSREPEANADFIKGLEDLLKSSQTSPSIPSLKIPSAGLALPPLTSLSIDLGTALPFIVLTLALTISLVIFLKQDKISSALARITPRISRPSYRLNIDSRVIKTYWNSVELLRKKVQRSPSDTHREYYERVSRTLPEADSVFRNITFAYEKVRWGALDEGALADEVDSNYVRLKDLVSKS
jgi:hypothetical protein